MSIIRITSQLSSAIKPYRAAVCPPFIESSFGLSSHLRPPNALKSPVLTGSFFHFGAQAPSCISIRGWSCRSNGGRAMAQSKGCYIGDVYLAGAKDGPLSGLTAVIKDSYDIAGHITSNGSPKWAETHPPAEKTAHSVQLLLDAGATIVGKTIMDEMAYSLEGENYHYGTPVNPACPERIPGGSSSGCAAAVACGDAEFGLGGDTGGSVRVPASYCGIFGIRPTHDRVSLSGSCPLAPSFDTGGWFARDPDVMIKVGKVLLKKVNSQSVDIHVPFKRWIVGTDAFDTADDLTTKEIYSVLSKKFEDVQKILGNTEEVKIADNTIKAPEGVDNASWLRDLDGWREIFRIHQAYEIWLQHGEWIQRAKPEFGPGIKERFEAASNITSKQFDNSQKLRSFVRERLFELLKNDGVLTIPTAVSCAPICNTPADDLAAYRSKLLRLTSISGLSGFPEVTIPIGKVRNCPVGLSLIGPPGSDERLLLAAKRLANLVIQ